LSVFPFALALVLAGFAATALLIPPLCRLAPRCGLLDHPGGRKRHAGAIPLVGGVAMMAVFVACFFAFGLFRTVTVYLPAAASLRIESVSGNNGRQYLRVSNGERSQRFGRCSVRGARKELTSCRRSRGGAGEACDPLLEVPCGSAFSRCLPCWSRPALLLPPRPEPYRCPWKSGKASCSS
jgi:hypothetical protein